MSLIEEFEKLALGGARFEIKLDHHHRWWVKMEWMPPNPWEEWNHCFIGVYETGKTLDDALALAIDKFKDARIDLRRDKAKGFEGIESDKRYGF